MAEARKTPETTEKHNSKCLSDEQPQVNHPASAIAAGACTGAIVGVGATVATVPIVQALGFTTAGTASESVAAGMTSSAAIAGGGGVASGSAVATLQSIGAAAAVPMGIAALTISIPGLVIAGVVNGLSKDKREAVSAFEPRDKRERCWVVAVEKGPGNVRVLCFSQEIDARRRFCKSWSMRVLYNTDGKEVASGGWNPWALATIRRVMKQTYFAD